MSTPERTAPDGTIAIPSLAGTVIVLREAPQLQVLMLRRQRTLRFMGGLWAFPGGAVDATEAGNAHEAARGTAGRIEAAARAACRELVEEAQLTVRPPQLTYFAHWITPSRAQRRFDTHFFLALAPANQEPHVHVAESSDLGWIEPGQFAYRDPPILELPMAAPTQMVLRELDQCRRLHGSVSSILAQAPSRDILTVMPKLIEDGMVLFPWDPGYTQAPGEGVDWDATAMATRSDWPHRLPSASAHPMGR
ncbi:MAG: NUDIX hydrolase [Proteobacteria bacterium]|nr:NUDIX hydrolase [Pseudomonadota bacterium]